MTEWKFKGRELVNCTCEYGCNCQFNALPDKGQCHAVAGIQIDEGHHGDTRLDGLRIAAIFNWPGPIDTAWVSLGTFRFEKGKGGSVEVGNAGADGHVIADAVQWLPVKE